MVNDMHVCEQAMSLTMPVNLMSVAVNIMADHYCRSLVDGAEPTFSV